MGLPLQKMEPPACLSENADLLLYLSGMQIINGRIPDKKLWRALVILSPEEALGRAWQLALALAHANKGQLIVGIYIDDFNSAAQKAAHALSQKIEELVSDVDNVSVLIITAVNFNKALAKFVGEAAVDLLIVHMDGPIAYNLNRVACAVAAVRGDTAAVVGETAVSGQTELEHIIIPTSGGPNTAYALTFLLPLTNKVKVTAVYIAPLHLKNEQALGSIRLRQLMKFVDGEEHIQTKVVT
ncbi:MAG: hypothetical protein GY805_20310, partial [Chloroflexi bacterium]|nr:hypothetical protein [Chloroflexota bacterium]